MAGIFKSFVTEKEVEEVKQKRQEEWEKVRRPDQPLERPEETYDHRTLYERLKVQKDIKQEEFLEQLKFKNMIYKGLDDEEASFLTFIAQRQADQETETIRREIEEVHTFRDAVAKLQDERELAAIQQTSSSLDKGDPLTSSSSSGGGGGVGGSGKPKIKSKQLALIAGSIKTKRKRSLSNEGEKDASTTSKSEETVECASPEKKLKLDQEAVVKDTSTPAERETSTEEADKSRKASTSHALSGLMAYSSSGSEDNDDDDS